MAKLKLSARDIFYELLKLGYIRYLEVGFRELGLQGYEFFLEVPKRFHYITFQKDGEPYYVQPENLMTKGFPFFTKENVLHLGGVVYFSLNTIWSVSAVFTTESGPEGIVITLPKDEVDFNPVLTREDVKEVLGLMGEVSKIREALEVL